MIIFIIYVCVNYVLSYCFVYKKKKHLKITKSFVQPTVQNSKAGYTKKEINGKEENPKISLSFQHM